MSSPITVVTAELLEAHDAYFEEVRRFRRVFPDGLPATQQGLVRALDGGFARVAWPWARKLGLGVDLSEADLRWADLSWADLSEANLSGANLYKAYLWGADLRDANLNDASLNDTNLRDANLNGANLRGADLEGADLRGADLRGADLRGADLRGVDLREAVGVPGWVREVEGAVVDGDLIEDPSKSG